MELEVVGVWDEVRVRARDIDGLAVGVRRKLRIWLGLG